MENWTEKYRPKSLGGIVGNYNAIEKLRRWGERWANGSPQTKAVILSGKAGVGKTSSAYALANDFGWQVVELNASDTRSGDAIRKVALSGAVNETFTKYGEYTPFSSGGRKLIILDEADNLYESKGDWGGKRAIVETIKETKQPIVLIVNDYYQLVKGGGTAFKTLCEYIKFDGVGEEMKGLLKSICRHEGVDVADDIIKFIISRSEGDVRGAINDLQTVCQGRKKVGMDVVTSIGHRNKEKEIFGAIREILRARDFKTAGEVARSTNEPPDYLILWMDENLPIEYKSPLDVERAYRFLSAADIFLGRTRRRQHYALWKYASDLMSGGVAVSKSRFYTAYPRYSFPLWLKKMGASKSIRTCRREVEGKIGRYAHMSGEKSRELIPTIRNIFKSNTRIAIELMRKLELSEDELSLLMEKNMAKKIMDMAKKEQPADSDAAQQQSIFDF
ncbi:MAG: replication factor C large subunit [Candidatus Thermoplasmatota archaeon]|nr:replication factor C large subunit [Candidatus Thermoplasmatota archaeon]